MKITLFAKSKKTHDGKPFTVFVGNLIKKDGTSQYCTVKYSGEDPRNGFEAKKCPYIIEFPREAANLTKKTVNVTDKETGEVKELTNVTLWIKDYKESEEKFVDHSLDEFQ